MTQQAIETGTDGGAALMPHPESTPSPGGMATGALMCLMSMASVQVGSALSFSAIETFGVAGATCLRLAIAALILALVVRPPVLRYSRPQWIGALVLGVTTALMTLSFFAAIQRLPLGLAVAIDFLGPLSVAAFGYGLGWRLVWPVIALAGVLLLSYDGQKWVGDSAGVFFAVCSAVGWAAYILLTKKVGAAFKGFEGLSMSLIVAALVSLPFGLSGDLAHMTPGGLGEMFGLAILVPLLPYALEMMALRRMPSASFGILMSMEPAMGAVVGFALLNQPMTVLQMGGTALVVASSLGASLSPPKS
jgi:inner membrane transporter RhtA